MSTDIKPGSLLVNVAKHSHSQVKDKGAGGMQPKSDPLASADSVSVTDKANRLQKISDQLSTLPTVNSDKVEQIRQALADGSYDFNPERVAARLIELEAGQHGRGSH